MLVPRVNNCKPAQDVADAALPHPSTNVWPVMLSEAGKGAKRASRLSRSIPTHSGFHPGIPLRCQIEPMGILLDDQRDLLCPAPTLEACLPRECLVHVIVRLPVQETSYIVLVRKSFEVVKLMLEYTLMQVARESD